MSPSRERQRVKYAPSRLPRPRRRFGQHFLVDRTVVGQIIELVRPRPDEGVVEIGPGRGVLTRPLSATLDRLVAVEIDRDLAEYLRGQISAPGFRLVEGDVLDVDLCELAGEEEIQQILMVGNIPYNITAPLIFRLLEQLRCVSRAILMVQHEVARRLVAEPGSSDYSMLSVILSMHAEAAVRLRVGPGCFRPSPKVESAVVEIEFSASCRRPVRDEEVFNRVVRTAFGQRRKMLRNSLLGLVQDGLRGDLKAIGEKADVDFVRRPETLSLEEFIRVSDAFSILGEKSTPQ